VARTRRSARFSTAVTTGPACLVAMREVEIAVRESAGLESNWIGKDLMRHAFKPEGGRLTDDEALPAEQQAIADIFAGAIGAFKNPSSHRTVEFEDGVEAAEIVQLADLFAQDRPPRRGTGAKTLLLLRSARHPPRRWRADHGLILQWLVG
jgi:uncharacterized protein (TIGR02391 family)